MAPPKRPWFRFYIEAIRDPKVKLLTPSQRWVWVTCLALARESHRPGELWLSRDLPFTCNGLAKESDAPIKVVRKAIETMLQLGLLDTNPENGCYFIPAWDSRQYESDETTKRTRKHRQRNADATLMERSINGDTATMERQRNAPETETDTDKKKIKRKSAINEDWQPSESDIAWAEKTHPHLDLATETQRFINHALANDRKAVAWGRAWRNWVIKAAEWAPQGAEVVPMHLRGESRA